MLVERIKKAILDAARAEAEKIESEAARKRGRDLAAAREQIEREFAGKFDAARQAAERESRQKLMQARSAVALELLARRNSILDDVFQQAAERVRDLPDDEYRKLVGDWMAYISAGSGGELLCRREDAERLGPLVEQLNAARDQAAALKLVPGDAPLLGGVILRTEKFEVNLSVDSRLANLREEMAPEVARMIFPAQTDRGA